MQSHPEYEPLHVPSEPVKDHVYAFEIISLIDSFSGNTSPIAIYPTSAEVTEFQYHPPRKSNPVVVIFSG